MKTRIGIDLGGTKIEAIALNEIGSEIFRKRIPTPRHQYSETLNAIEFLVRQIKEKVDTEELSIGIGTPGAISPTTGRIKNSNSTWLINQPLREDLEKKLGHPIRLANDADCFALSESVDGAAAGATVVFGVILGTGVGGGIVVNGKCLNGPNAISGEWGHNALPWPTLEELPGPPCYCGRSGCIETYLSGPGLSRSYENQSGTKVAGIEVTNLAKQDPVAKRVLEVFTHRLARSLASVINILDPDVIVLGGGVSNMESIYTEVPILWDKFVFSDSVTTKIVKAKFGDSSGVRGAAWL